MERRNTAQRICETKYARIETARSYTTLAVKTMRASHEKVSPHLMLINHNRQLLRLLIKHLHHFPPKHSRHPLVPQQWNNKTVKMVRVQSTAATAQPCRPLLAGPTGTSVEGQAWLKA